MTGIVLAGGKSTRMGRDKPTLSWDSSDLLNVIVESLGTICDDLIVVSNIERNIKQDGVRVVADIMPYRGPLAGIHAGLSYARHKYAFVTACDMPYIIPSAVEYLFQEVQGWEIAIPKHGEYYEPLFSCYSKDCLSKIELHFTGKTLSITKMLNSMRFKAIDCDKLRIFDPELKIFTNINTEEDYMLASKSKILSQERVL